MVPPSDSRLRSCATGRLTWSRSASSRAAMAHRAWAAEQMEQTRQTIAGTERRFPNQGPDRIHQLFLFVHDWNCLFTVFG